MSFSETTILSTREPCFGDRRLGQIAPVPSGRIDKVSLYLEPYISDSTVADSVEVRVELYMVDSSRIPSGAPLASDSIALSDVKTRGFRNFRVETDTPSTVAIVLRTIGGTPDNHVAWRYTSTSSSGEELLISENDGATWAQDTGRKFAFIAYSKIDDVIDSDDQSVSILPGRARSQTDDSAAEWSLAELTRTAISGDTVIVSFGDFVVTLVVDQSGSMTWNDNSGLRFDFLKDYIDDMEASLPATSSASYAIVKFRSRQVGSLDIVLQTQTGSGFVEGVRIVRKTGSPPTSPSDGLVVFEGFATQYEDQGLSSGTLYHYGISTFDSEGNFSDLRTLSAIPQSPPASPIGVAALKLEEVITLSGDFDIGYREVQVSWVNPEGFGYDKVTIVRRTDRFPETEDDGVAVVFDPRVTTSFTDFDPLSVDPDDHAVTGLTYYYRIFSEDTATGLRTLTANCRTASVSITPVDRVWERAEAPFDVPPPGFDDTPPGAPSISATEGDGQVLLSWSAADVDTRRFKVYFKEDEFPRQETLENGFADFDGELIFDGDGSSFLHKDLDNAQPHFYVIVALDQVGNQSAETGLIARPESGSTATIAPPSPSNFAGEVVNASRVLLTWSLDVVQASSVEAFFGDAVRVTAALSFQDADPRVTSANLEFVEDGRTVFIFDSTGAGTADGEGTVDEDAVLLFDQAPVTDTSSLSADVVMTPFTNLLNPISSAELSVHASVNVRQRSTNDVITEIISNQAKITFKNPFDLRIINDPPQTVPVRTFNLACDELDRPQYDTSTADGVFARSGESFSMLIEARFRDEPLDDDIDIAIRILDAETGDPSRIVLPEMDDDGVAVFRTSEQSDEVLDRTGEPTGETEDRNLTEITIPPQDIPGEFVLEATASFEGFSRTVFAPFQFVSSLNIDLKTRPFFPDGTNIAEQEAFVYFGPFDASDEDKTPVPDDTVVNWELTKIAGGGPPSRPFFDRENVPGSGVKSLVNGGVARNVFFGPGTDIEPPRGVVTCTDGELYSVRVTASALGMEGEAFGLVELFPFAPTDLKRIFLRLAQDQVDEFGNDVVTTDLAAIGIFADGTQEAAYEVVARPEEDTETGIRSGTFFRDSVVSSGGIVPSLKDGTVVNISVTQIGNTGSPDDVIITSDLNPNGARARAKATVINGKAEFSLKANLRITGTVKERPLSSEVSNQFYNTESLLWEDSPSVFAVQVYTTLEINGKPAIFGGGGGSITDVPPAYVSFFEPLDITTGQ